MIPNRKFRGVIKHSETKVENPKDSGDSQKSSIEENCESTKSTETTKKVKIPDCALSILIPSHNRDITNTLKSIAELKIPYKYEILVNDDSMRYNKEFFRKFNLPIKLHKHRNRDLTGVYKTLFRYSKGKYLYYLEDDDFLLAPFTQALKTMVENNIDLMYCNYMGYEDLKLEFNKTDIFKGSEKTTLVLDAGSGEYTVEGSINSEFLKFCKTYNHYDLFQLGRFIFRKSICKYFPRGNNVLNDWHLFRHLLPKIFATSEYIIYKQNVNGDNISFEIKKPFYRDENALMVDLSLPYYRK